MSLPLRTARCDVDFLPGEVRLTVRRRPPWSSLVWMMACLGAGLAVVQGRSALPLVLGMLAVALELLAAVGGILDGLTRASSAFLPTLREQLVLHRSTDAGYREAPHRPAVTVDGTRYEDALAFEVRHQPREPSRAERTCLYLRTARAYVQIEPVRTVAGAVRIAEHLRDELGLLHAPVEVQPMVAWSTPRSLGLIAGVVVAALAVGAAELVAFLALPLAWAVPLSALTVAASYGLALVVVARVARPGLRRFASEVYAIDPP